MLASIVALGDLAGDVRARRARDERERLDLPRLPRRVRREGAAAARSTAGSALAYTRGTARGRRRSSRASSRRPPCSGSSGSCCPHFPEPVDDFRTLVLVLAVRDARLRLGARLPPAGHPRRDRVLVDGPDGPDRARDLRGQRPRARRRGAPLGQPRPRLGGLLPARRDDRDARRHRRLRRARRDGEGPPDPRDARAGARDVHARRARLDELRGRVLDPRGRLRPRLGLRRGRRRWRWCSPRSTRCG